MDSTLPFAPREGASLTEAFSHFIAASSRLEGSYRDLQKEVAELTLALSERNRALSQSQFENELLGIRLRCILETIPCGVLVVGEEGAVRLANPEAARLLALPTACYPAEAPRSGRAAELRLELQIPLPAAEQEQEICLDGPVGPVWLAVRRAPLPATEVVTEVSREAVLTLRDITARKRMEEEREAARDAVALAQVSALLAHEIRNPLASMELFAGLLEGEPERHDEWLSHLRAGIRSLSGTVNNVLTLHGDVSLHLGPVEVLTETALAIDFLQPAAKQAQVRLYFRAGDLLPCTQAHTHRSAFQQIMLNLCVNALRHTPAGGSVEVRCGASAAGAGAMVWVSVSDTGCGIPSEHLSYLFEVGFSGSGASSGLGLAVCDRLVRQMGGRIAVDSRVGRGSTFTVELLQA